MSKKTSTLATLVMVSLILVLCFGGISMTSENQQPGKGKVPGEEKDRWDIYEWQDDAGNSYVTVKSTNPVDPKEIYPHAPGLEFIPVDKEGPCKSEKGFQIKTYQLVKKIKKTSKIVENNSPAVIYMVGETHLGNSPKQVAKIMANLTKKHEIDAIFLEQPDHLIYNWENFQSFEKNPGMAIAALRQRMLSDAGRKSESISAADYFYVMFNFLGIKIPFLNLDSSKLRENFENLLKQNKNVSVKEELGPRDDYMVAKAKEIIETKGYRQVILLCGAYHINNLKSRFTTIGYNANIIYNFNLKPGNLIPGVPPVGLMPEIPKPVLPVGSMPLIPKTVVPPVVPETWIPKTVVMSVVPKPVIIKLVPPVVPRPVIIKPGPPVVPGPRIPITEVPPVVQTWIPKTEPPVVTRELSPPVPYVDAPNISQLKKINQANKDTSLTFTVENRISRFDIYRDDFEPVYEGNDFSQLFQALMEESSKQPKLQAIYLDMKDFDEDKIELFASSLQMQKEKGDIKVMISIIPRIDNSTDTRDTFLMPYQIELASKNRPNPEQITWGERSGWYRTTFNFILKIGNVIKYVSITIYTRTQEMAFRFFEILRSKFSSGIFEGSLASMVNQVYRELIESSEDETREMIKEFRDQAGNILFVFIRPIPGMTHQLSLEKAA